MADKKPGILDYKSEVTDFQSVMNSINQQAATLAEQGNELSPEQEIVAARSQSDPRDLQQESPFRPRSLNEVQKVRRNKLRRMQRNYANSDLPNEPVETSLPGLPNYQFPFEAPAQFLPKGDAYQKAGNKFAATAQARRARSASENAEFLLGNIEPGLSRYGTLATPMSEMSTVPDPTRLRKQQSLSASLGRGLL